MEVKPFSQACENNKNPIFSVLAGKLANVSTLLEIGSGTGQHAIFFTERLTHLTWQTTDQGEYFPQLQQLIARHDSTQLPKSLVLDVNQEKWPVESCEVVFTANSLHIMSWLSVQKLFRGVDKHLQKDGDFYIYGPFNYQGEFTSDSNKGFDLRLKASNAERGIRHFEDIKQLADNLSLEFLDDFTMPANNRLLHFRKK